MAFKLLKYVTRTNYIIKSRVSLSISNAKWGKRKWGLQIKGGIYTEGKKRESVERDMTFICLTKNALNI